MTYTKISFVLLSLFAGLASAAEPAPSGIDRQYIDSSVRPQDDFFRYMNGKWLATEEIPADKSTWGSFAKLRDDTQPQLHAIIEAAAKDASAKPGSEARKIGDLYASFMDEKKLDEAGLKPLAGEMAKIAALRDRKDVPALIAHFNQIGVKTPYAFGVHQDAKDSTRYVVDFFQSGLGLPDRDYYLKQDDARLADVRAKYQAQIEKMLAMADDKDAAEHARQILALETALAQVQWTKVENRDPVKRYNKFALSDFDKLVPSNDWKSYFLAAGIAGKIDYVIVSQPSYFSGFDKVLNETPLNVWQAYFSWHLINSYAPYLSRSLVDQDFAFSGTILRGIPENLPRWKRGVALVDRAVGEGVGKLYVAQHFPPERKARMEALVKNLLVAYRESIATLDWMSAETKKEAQVKLAKFTPKIGYPNKWRDYSALKIDRDDLVGNLMRTRAFEHRHEIDKLGKPIDRDEWHMTPQTVNAYYNGELNEIVFPAAILRPPFFDANADDAVNYGGIGAVIGHEISHGFDDKGSKYDGNGNLRDWWTKDDHLKFSAKTGKLVEQYGAFSPLPGYRVNGELTLGENIADLSGLAIAYKAYHLSLAGRKSPEIDGMTGEQRLYQGWAQVWRAKTRDQEAIVRIKTDPHSPPQFRANGTLQNQPGFYAAFGLKEGDKMYLAPEKRVIIW
jgi:predicted metalloendopeptidase